MHRLRVTVTLVTANFLASTGTYLHTGQAASIDGGKLPQRMMRSQVVRNENLQHHDNLNTGHQLMRRPQQSRKQTNKTSEVIEELHGLRHAIDGHIRSGKIGPPNDGQAKFLQTGGGMPTWQAFAVTLQRRPQRLAGFIKALQKQESWLTPHISYVWAIDGMELAKDRTARNVLVEKGYVSMANLKQSLKEPLAVSWWDLSPGAIGCYISHAKVWEQIVDRDLDYGLIFEDDMRHFRNDFEKIVRADYLEAKQTPETQGDIVYLQHCDSSADWDRGSPTPPEGESTPRELDSDLIVPCTAGYLISQRAARQLLYSAFPIKVQLDRAMAGGAIEGLRRLRYEPALAQVGNASAASDVQESSTSITWLLHFLGFKIGDMLGLYDNVTETPDNATLSDKLTEIKSNVNSTA